jgi:hypothetical protein
VRLSRVLATATVFTVLALTGCGGAGAGGNDKVDRSTPAVGACLKLAKVNELTQQRAVNCKSRHEGQVYAILALPAAITDPAVHKQVTSAKSALNCPDVKAWAGYTGHVPLGLFRTWRFPTKQQIAAGARWVSCVAILAPGPDHLTLKATVGTLSGKLAGVTNPLPLLGQCAATHTNTAFVPVTCVPASTQWVWLGAHKKPSGSYPGTATAKKVADTSCKGLVATQGRGHGWVYFPTSAASWARTGADWSCWMPLAQVGSTTKK